VSRFPEPPRRVDALLAELHDSAGRLARLLAALRELPDDELTDEADVVDLADARERRERASGELD
jgi:hypothetical protein